MEFHQLEDSAIAIVWDRCPVSRVSELKEGRIVSNSIKFDAFKSTGEDQVAANQDAFARLFGDVCTGMGNEEFPSGVQAKSIT